MYIARKTLPYQRCSSFRCELSSWWWWYICHRNMSELKWSSNDFVLSIKFVHYCWYILVNNVLALLAVFFQKHCGGELLLFYLQLLKCHALWFEDLFDLSNNFDSPIHWRVRLIYLGDPANLRIREIRTCEKQEMTLQWIECKSCNSDADSFKSNLVLEIYELRVPWISRFTCVFLEGQVSWPRN
jgi:hypothetical protein